MWKLTFIVAIIYLVAYTVEPSEIYWFEQYGKYYLLCGLILMLILLGLRIAKVWQHEISKKLKYVNLSWLGLLFALTLMISGYYFFTVDNVTVVDVHRSENHLYYLTYTLQMFIPPYDSLYQCNRFGFRCRNVYGNFIYGNYRTTSENTWLTTDATGHLIRVVSRGEVVYQLNSLEDKSKLPSQVPSSGNRLDPDCPIPTPQPIWVEPVTSPTYNLNQTIVVHLGRGEEVTIETEAGIYVERGNFSAYRNPARLDIDLDPDRVHHLRVIGRVQSFAHGNCRYQSYTLQRTNDLDGQPLTIQQQTQ